MEKQISFPDDLACPAPRKTDPIIGRGIDALVLGDVFL